MQVLEGGPVAPDRGFVIHSPKEGYESSLTVGPDIMVTTSRDVLTAVAEGNGPEKYIVALGYAGWGGGQLEGELRENAWLTVMADSDIVFDMPLTKRFDEALGVHCYETSRIVEAYSGGWYGKNVYQGDGLTRDKVEAFARYAFRKIRSELVRRRDAA